jgi:hypothetical protein
MDKMMTIDQMNYFCKDMVILLDLNVIDIKIKVIVKAQMGFLHLLISLTCVLVRGFILVVYLINQSGECSRSTCADLRCCQLWYYLLSMQQVECIASL